MISALLGARPRTLNRIDGQLIIDRVKIVKNYLKLKFWLDILTTFSILLNVVWIHSRTVELMIFIRFYQLGQILERINERFQYKQRYEKYYDLVKITILIFLMAHLFGCAFYYLAIYENKEFNDNNTWINTLKVTNLSQKDQYVTAIYFAFITMMTIGYGDITPQTTLERLFIMLMAIFSTALFGFAVGAISSILQGTPSAARHHAPAALRTPAHKHPTFQSAPRGGDWPTEWLTHFPASLKVGP